MRPQKKKTKCFLCELRLGKHRIVAGDYMKIGNCVITLPGVIVKLCHKCWFRKGFMDTSFYIDVERKLWTLLNKEGKVDGKDS